jgi:hypothetical protein
MSDVSLNTILSNVNNNLSIYDGNNAGIGSQLQTLGTRLQQDTVSGNTGDYKSTLGQYLGLLGNAEKMQPGASGMIQAIIAELTSMASAQGASSATGSSGSDAIMVDNMGNITKGGKYVGNINDPNIKQELQNAGISSPQIDSMIRDAQQHKGASKAPGA